MGSRTLAVAALLVGVSVTPASGAPAAERLTHFTFRTLEFLPEQQALELATEFARAELPRGMPVAPARRRLKRAGLGCEGPVSSQAPVTCGFSEPVHIEGGVIGEDRWTVRLLSDEQGRLLSAHVEHGLIGVGGLNPQ